MPSDMVNVMPMCMNSPPMAQKCAYRVNSNGAESSIAMVRKPHQRNHSAWGSQTMGSNRPDMGSVRMRSNGGWAVMDNQPGCSNSLATPADRYTKTRKKRIKSAGHWAMVDCWSRRREMLRSAALNNRNSSAVRTIRSMARSPGG